jgi:hypothetical protein
MKAWMGQEWCACALDDILRGQKVDSVLRMSQKLSAGICGRRVLIAFWTRSRSVEVSLLYEIIEVALQVVPLKKSRHVSSNMTKVKAHKAWIEFRIFRHWCSGTISLRLGVSARKG